MEWKIPTKIKKVESFLKFANFYQRFIKNFSHIAKPLNELKGKKKWKQEKKHQEAFKELKKQITSQPVLTFLKIERKFQVKTNALRYAIEGVLSQEQEGKQRPIMFLSRIIQLAERNYKIYNKELLIVIKTLTKWRQYLLDATEKFEVWTDYKISNISENHTNSMNDK